MEKTFENLLSVTGMPSLHFMVANRPNGLIVEDIATNKRSFVSSRKHQFTPLISIGIYTQDGEAEELMNVFSSMKKHTDSPPEASSSPEDLTAYFSGILPTFDREAVRISDIRKCIKWYRLVEKHTDIASFLTRSEEEE